MLICPGVHIAESSASRLFEICLVGCFGGKVLPEVILHHYDRGVWKSEHLEKTHNRWSCKERFHIKYLECDLNPRNISLSSGDK